MAVSTQKSCYLNPLKDTKELARLTSEREWILNKIESVKTKKLPYKPSASREIRDLEYQAKRNELELTFGGHEWKNYEKYAMWDLLTR
jgi:hypothetical protein